MNRGDLKILQLKERNSTTRFARLASVASRFARVRVARHSQRTFYITQWICSLWKEGAYNVTGIQLVNFVFVVKSIMLKHTNQTVTRWNFLKIQFWLNLYQNSECSLKFKLIHKGQKIWIISNSILDCYMVEILVACFIWEIWIFLLWKKPLCTIWLF